MFGFQCLSGSVGGGGRTLNVLREAKHRFKNPVFFLPDRKSVNSAATQEGSSSLSPPLTSRGTMGDAPDILGWELGSVELSPVDSPHLFKERVVMDGWGGRAGGVNIGHRRAQRHAVGGRGLC